MNRKQLNSFLNLIPGTSVLIGSPRKQATTNSYCSQANDCSIKLLEREEADYITALPSFFSGNPVQTGFTRFVAELKNARVWGRNGAVITDNDSFLTDVSYEFHADAPSAHSVFYTLRQKKPVEYSQPGAVISHPGAGVYYHWMMDILPRIGLLKQFYDLETIQGIVCDYTALPFQTETLVRAAVRIDQLIRSNDNWNFHARFSRLLLPSLAGFHDQPGLFQINYLRSLFADVLSDGKPFRKLYISRKHTGRRHLLNEDELIDLLTTAGFEIIYCEELEVAAQAKLFSEAAVVAGPHGSAFTNLVFCQPGTVVIDLFNQSQINPCFWILSKLSGLQYHFFTGESIAADHNYKNDHINIDLSFLQQQLLRLGIL